MDHWFGISSIIARIRDICFWRAIAFPYGRRIAITVSRIIHIGMKRINMYIRFQLLNAITGRLAITPSWLFNVSLARANILEKFRCLVITLPVALYCIIRTFVHSVWIIFARRNCWDACLLILVFIINFFPVVSYIYTRGNAHDRSKL